MTKMFVNVELVTGEGVVLEIEGPADTPAYFRWYLPNEDENCAALVEAFWDDKAGDAFMWSRPEEEMISIQAAPAWERKPDYVGLDSEEAHILAGIDGYQSRIVLEDGKPHAITADTNENRINFYVAHGKVYRAEVF